MNLQALALFIFCCVSSITFCSTPKSRPTQLDPEALSYFPIKMTQQSKLNPQAQPFCPQNYAHHVDPNSTNSIPSANSATSSSDSANSTKPLYIPPCQRNQ